MPRTARELEARRRPRPGARGPRQGKPRRWFGETLEAMRVLYVDEQLYAREVAERFHTTETQVYRLARMHNWPHRQVGRVPAPTAVARLGWKHAEIYRHLKPSIGHDAALAEAWRGKAATARQAGQGVHG